jgi:8-oxo-dGTP pyrophosphatase MutT (NUDIX family)
LTFEKAVAVLKDSAGKILPGIEAQYRMAPALRKTLDDYILLFPDHRKSAVLLLIYPDQNNIANLLLIERPSGDHVHSGQIALPGGRIEELETSADAAKRETEEEVGVKANAIEIIFPLTELFIPASKFLVQPFAGIVGFTPEFIPGAGEVASLVPVSLEELITLEVFEKQFKTFYGNIVAPYYNIKGHAVWGATAMILSEFRQLIGAT